MDEFTKQLSEAVAPHLGPYVEWLPDGVRAWLLGEGVYFTLAVLFLAVVLVLALAVRFVEKFFAGLRRLVMGSPPKDQTEKRLREDLDSLPLPSRPPGPGQLAWYHVPVRVRLVVLAPLGRDEKIDVGSLHRLLDRMVPGLGEAVRHDEPCVRLWPNQLSEEGFGAVFHRCTPRPEGEGRESRWILLAGKTMIGKHPYLLGLGLYADRPVTQPRVTLQPVQWMDVLRIRS